MTIRDDPAVNEHLTQFAHSRKDWHLLELSEMILDEIEGARDHKYPKTHPYITGMKYALDKLKQWAPCEVLDIGSPLAQNVAAGCIPGVDVTVIDIRQNADSDMLGLKWRVASATALPYQAASWSFVTSLWVMGHVGDARYGDALDVDGDRNMLAEVARVLRPGGIAIIGPGLVADAPGNIFNLHRIYSWPWLRVAFDEAGFDVLEEQELDVAEEIFIHGPGAVSRQDGKYALALLRKR